MTSRARSGRAVRHGAAVALMGLVLAGCTLSTEGTGGSGPTGSATASATSEPADSDSIASMLALLPPEDGDDLGILTVTRWHAAAEAYGIAVPDGSAPDEVLNYLRSLTSGDGGLTSASDLMSLPLAATRSTEEEFGYGRDSIAVEASAGTAPRVVQAAQGGFDVDDITAATQAGPVGEDVEQTDVDGVPVLRWREDFALDLKQITALSKVGSAGRLAVPDASTLLYATYDAGIEALISAQQGGPSLADDEDLAAIAAALDQRDVLSAQLTYRPDGSALPYTAAGIGFAWEGSGRIVIAYSTPSDADARDVAQRIEDLVTTGSTGASNRPWSELLASPDVRADGSVVTATFDAQGTGSRWAAFLPYRENLF